MKINISKTNMVTLGGLFLIAVANPLSVGYIGHAGEIVINYFTLYGNYGFVIGLMVLSGVSIHTMFTTNKTNIPKVKSLRKH